MITPKIEKTRIATPSASLKTKFLITLYLPPALNVPKLVTDKKNDLCRQRAFQLRCVFESGLQACTRYIY